MENFLRDYLRILDIDPFGCFIRLINISHKQSLDLSNISIRQVSLNLQVLHSYTFDEQIRPFLPHGEVVTIYSRDYRQLKFNIEPYIFLAKDIWRWSIDDQIRTEISWKNIVFDSYKFSLFASSDIPLLFIQQPVDSRRLFTTTTSHSDRYARFTFPYCLPSDNLVNPHTWGNTDGNEIKLRRKMCDENHPNVQYFDSYARRLTTAPKMIVSSKTTSNARC